MANNDDVARAFAEGKKRSAGAFKSTGDEAFSYAMKIAQRMPGGSVQIISRERAPSPTTKNHIRELQSEFSIRHPEITVLNVSTFSGTTGPDRNYAEAHGEYSHTIAKRRRAEESRRAGLGAFFPKKSSKSALYEVIVGNVGKIHSGKALKKAKEMYAQYVEISKIGAGRAGGEDVTLMKDGEPIAEYGGHDAPASASRHEAGNNPRVSAPLKARIDRVLGKGKNHGKRSR